MPQPKYSAYQDYVIREGRLIGEFEEMYRDHADPWHQTDAELHASDKAVALNLLARLHQRHGLKRAVEIGSGLGHYAARIAATGFETTGIEVAPTAVEKASRQFPQVRFLTGDIKDHALIVAQRPDVIVMAEVTWYVLAHLAEFRDFLKRELPDCLLLHTLTVYPEGKQSYGREFFTDLDGIRAFFGMECLEWGEVCHRGGGKRTWFLGTWDEAVAARW